MSPSTTISQDSPKKRTELTDAERDVLVEMLISSAMGYESASELMTEYGWDEDDLLNFCVENSISQCCICGWYNEEEDMGVTDDGEYACIECMDE